MSTKRKPGAALGAVTPGPIFSSQKYHTSSAKKLKDGATICCDGATPDKEQYSPNVIPSALVAKMFPLGKPGPSSLVSIQAGEAIPRFTREALSKRTEGWQFSVIEGDLPSPSVGAPSPSAFDSATLRWAVRNATLIVVWAAGWEADPKAFATIRCALEKGGRVTIILTRPERESDWLEALVALDWRLVVGGGAEWLLITTQPEACRATA
jgi:hypothetical protein